jgi:hypothetical protein
MRGAGWHRRFAGGLRCIDLNLLQRALNASHTKSACENGSAVVQLLPDFRVTYKSQNCSRFCRSRRQEALTKTPLRIWVSTHRPAEAGDLRWRPPFEISNLKFAISVTFLRRRSQRQGVLLKPHRADPALRKNSPVKNEYSKYLKYSSLSGQGYGRYAPVSECIWLQSVASLVGPPRRGVRCRPEGQNCAKTMPKLCQNYIFCAAAAAADYCLRLITDYSLTGARPEGPAPLSVTCHSND